MEERSEMGDARWEMGDGRWEMGDGRWEMGDGRWEMADGRWEMGDGRWQMGDGRWEMEDGKNLPHLPEGRGGIGRCPRQGDGKRRPLSGATLNRDLSSLSGDGLLHHVQ